VIVITADHGEFGEHGEVLHGNTPATFARPSRAAPARAALRGCALVDVAPTVWSWWRAASADLECRCWCRG
jgi:hypothetical protein